MSDGSDSGQSTHSLFYRTLMGTALAMISFGQFNDTKELLTGIYEDITTNFTHQVQFEQLESLSIGRTTSFVETFFGPPEVIKVSRLNPDVQFQYYNIEKAVVTILNHKGRVSGFVVIPINQDFAPQMPYVDTELGAQSFSDSSEGEGDFFFDANNLVYFAESRDLGKRYLFLQMVQGFVEYGGLTRELNETPANDAQTIKAVDFINEKFEMDEEEALNDAMIGFRNEQSANFYAYTEMDVALIPESLLTRFEFDTYFGADE